MGLNRFAFCFIASFVLSSACGKEKEGADPEEVQTPSGSTKGKEAEAVSPVPGTGPMFSAITSSSYVVSWEPAKDDKSAALLEYQLVSATTTEALDSLAKAEAIAGSGIAMQWTKAGLTKTVTGAAPATERAYAVLMRDAEGHKALYAAQKVTTLALGAPQAGAAITLTDLSKSGFRVNWGAASDADDTSFQYKVVRASTGAQIDSVAEIDAVSGASASDWLDDETSYEFTGLDLGTQYSVAVLVKDSAGLTALYSPVSG